MLKANDMSVLSKMSKSASQEIKLDVFIAVAHAEELLHGKKTTLEEAYIAGFWAALEKFRCDAEVAEEMKKELSRLSELVIEAEKEQRQSND